MSEEEYELFNYVYDMGIGEIASEDILKAGELQKKILTKLKSIDEVIDYCEEITSREIDISDTDYDLGQDFTARDILKIVRGEENENN